MIWKRSSCVRLALVLLGVIVTMSANGVEQAVAQQSSEADEIDTSGHGAVLCIYMINLHAAVTGRVCYPGKDEVLQSALDESLARIEAFVLENSSISAAELARWRQEYTDRQKDSGQLCSGESADLYKTLRDRGAEALRASTDKLLSVPRKPVMNPCL
jgi:hypothetical protein